MDTASSSKAQDWASLDITLRHSEIEDGETPVKVKKENEKEFLTKVKVEKDEVFRCETQMIETYIRHERRDPDTRRVSQVLHGFSFCNHADLPDHVLESVIRERWKDLFGLTGPKDSSMPADMPDKINIIQNSNPDIESFFPPQNESGDACKYCDWRSLQKLTKYHLKKEIEARGTAETEN